MKVLIAEDNPFYQKLLTEYFERNDMSVVCHNHVDHTIEDLESDNWDLIILDINLVDGKSYETMKVMEDLDISVPVILISGEKILDGHLPDLNYVGWLRKPFDISELTDCLKHCLPENRADIDHIEYSEKIDNSLEKDEEKKLLLFCETMGPIASIQLIEMFSDSLKTEVPKLRFFREQMSFPDIEALAHQLKSNAKYFGFDQFGGLCEKIELMAKANDLMPLDGAIAEIEQRTPLVLKRLSLTLEKTGGNIDPIFA